MAQPRRAYSAGSLRQNNIDRYGINGNLNLNVHLNSTQSVPDMRDIDYYGMAFLFDPENDNDIDEEVPTGGGDADYVVVDDTDEDDNEDDDDEDDDDEDEDDDDPIEVQLLQEAQQFLDDAHQILNHAQQFLAGEEQFENPLINLYIFDGTLAERRVLERALAAERAWGVLSEEELIEDSDELLGQESNNGTMVEQDYESESYDESTRIPDNENEESHRRTPSEFTMWYQYQQNRKCQPWKSWFTEQLAYFFKKLSFFVAHLIFTIYFCMVTQAILIDSNSLRKSSIKKLVQGAPKIVLDAWAAFLDGAEFLQTGLHFVAPKVPLVKLPAEAESILNEFFDWIVGLLSECCSYIVEVFAA